ncbi:hypothetical protein LP7551_03618 [Roseibium album]|nr:hypothetical protein LP7551_03618 [Roseibium album]
MTKPAKSNNVLWIALALGVVALCVTPFFMDVGNTADFIRRLHGN